MVGTFAKLVSTTIKLKKGFLRAMVPSLLFGIPSLSYPSQSYKIKLMPFWLNALHLLPSFMSNLTVPPFFNPSVINDFAEYLEEQFSYLFVKIIITVGYYHSDFSGPAPCNTGSGTSIRKLFSPKRSAVLLVPYPLPL